MKTLKDPSVLLSLQRALEGAEGSYKGFYATTTSMARIWISLHTVPIFGPTGKIQGGVGLLEDISELHRAEDDLKRAYELQGVINTLLRLSMEDISLEKVLEEVIDQVLSIPWLVLESRGAILLVEEEPEVLVLKVQQGLHPELQERCARVPFGRCLCGRAAQKKEIEFACSVDSRHDICYSNMIPHGHYCAPILFSGRVLGVINLYLKDGHVRREWEENFLQALADSLGGIISRKRVQDDLRHSEERFRALFNQAADCILTMDPSTPDDPVIVEANQAAHTMHGYSPGELIGKPISFLDTPETRTHIAGRVVRLMAGDHLTGEVQHIRKDGSTFPIEISAQVIRIAGKLYIQAIDRDITERKQGEQERLFLEAQLLQAQKMEAVGRLAGGVAHDFNNLLTIILGYAELMRFNLREEDPLLNNLEEIRKAADRAAGLTRQLLAFSRRQVLQPRIINLNLVIEDLEKMLKRLIGEDLILQTVLQPGLGRVMVDPGQIEQVIMNLVVNARDALPGGGLLTIETGNVEIDQAQADKNLDMKAGGYVLLSVSDTGVGMDQETRSHIFEPFFTTKERGKGTGLGLSTVYGIIKQSRGYVWVTSEPDQGTTFKIYLPRVEEEALVTKEEESSVPLLKGDEIILVVEDDDQVKRLTCTLLKQSGYRVLEADRGEEALRVSGTQEGLIHLMITDLIMPGMNGSELAKQIKSSRPETQILYMSGYTDIGDFQNELLDSGRPFLQKPFSPEVLTRKVRELLDAQPPDSGSDGSNETGNP